jgi:hypothetical protein
VSGLLTAQVKDGVVGCGGSCPGVLGRLLPHHLLLAVGLVELHDEQGKPYDPPCYAQARSVRRRVGAAAVTGKSLPPLRSRSRYGDQPPGQRDQTLPYWGNRVVTADHDIWVECPRCRARNVVRLVSA